MAALTAPAAAERVCQRAACGEPLVRRPAEPRVTWEARKYCCHACSAAARRDAPCPNCGQQDWYVAPSGKRACRPCKAKRSADLRREDTARRGGDHRRRRPRPAPAPAPAPAAAVSATPTPVWRPPGFPPEPVIPAHIRPLTDPQWRGHPDIGLTRNPLGPRASQVVRPYPSLT